LTARPVYVRSGGFRESARQLYHDLVEPFMKDMKGIRALTVLPDGALHYLPFDVLISPSGKMLLADLEIVHAPSLATIPLTSAKGGASAPPSELLAVGDPKYPASVRGDAIQDVVRSVRTAGFRLRPLPMSRVEVEAIGALYAPSERKVLMGAEATESVVKRSGLGRFRIIHFAAHTLLDERVPDRSGIVLSLVAGQQEDGILRSSEVRKLELNADLVVLSACQSGLGRLVRGDGVVGLTQAFLEAGARQVVTTLWDVPDLSAARLMVAFHRALKRGLPAPAALRAAKLDLLNGPDAFRHPYYWAQFVLWGYPRWLSENGP
jgi:CHAT domain-containing protein